MLSENNIELTQELSQNFIDFSYEANSQRAFADARDGLKPGQRACLWEMYDKGYTSNKPHVKSAKIDGGVVANWWPHGTTAVYDTFARMSQSWINNIPEVSWHGANGSVQISGEAAADRYTEARLSKQAEDGLLYNIKKNNVPMRLNFSEDAEWPEVLPAIIPRLMINGCQGIGSTIANVWIPNDLCELADVIKNYVETNNLDYSNLYPSFPTGGIIINKNTAQDMYKTGKGKVIVRAKTEIKNNIIEITEIPYQVYVEPLIEQIKKLVLDDTIIGIESVINKSDKQKLLIEIECSGAPKTVLNNLFRKTDLQKTYNANQYALVGKSPRMLNLKQYLDVYINHNLNCIIRENEYDLAKAKDRIEIVEGLIKALEDIDNIISLIKASDSSKDAISKLINKYNFTERQAKAIVDMKLGRLAKLEKIELNNELIELTSTIEKCTEIINNDNKQKEIFIARLFDFVRKYPSKRKTEVIQVSESPEEKEIEYVEPEKCVVIMTEAGSIKRIPTASFRTQNRGGKGVKTQDEITNAVIRTNTIDSLMIFSNKGNMYRLLVNDVPAGTNASKGTPIKALVSMETGEEPAVMYSIYRDTNAEYVIFITKNGIVKKTKLSEYVETKKKTGLKAINIKDGDELATVSLIKDEPLLIITAQGMMIKVKSKEFGASGRVTMGLKGITLKPNDYVVAALPIRHSEDKLAIFSTTGYGKRISLDNVLSQSRGGKGTICFKSSPTNGSVAGAQLVSDEDNVLIISDKSSICISAKDIPSVISKDSIGNILVKGGRVLSVSKV